MAFYTADPHVIGPRCLLLMAADYVFDLWRSQTPFIFGSSRCSCVPPSIRLDLVPANPPTRRLEAVDPSCNIVLTPPVGKSHKKYLESPTKGHSRQLFLVGGAMLMLLLRLGPRPSQPPIFHGIMHTICAEQQQHRQRSCAMSQGVKVCFAAILSTEDSSSNN